MNLEKLIKLYQKMADITLEKCKQCIVPLSCCSNEYCEIAEAYAKEKYNINLKLKHTGHSKLLFMSDKGCVVPPYLRPMCTMHTCSINSLGFEKNDPKMTYQYFILRNKIEELENERAS